MYIVDSSDAPVANLLLYSPGAWAESKESNHIYGSYQASTATGLAQFSVPAQDLDYIPTLVLICSDGFSVVAEKYIDIDLRKLYQQNGSPVIKVVWDEITPNEAAAKNQIVTAKFELPNGEPAANYKVYFELGNTFEAPIDEIFSPEDPLRTVEISNETKKLFRARKKSFSRYTDEQGKVTFGSSDIETGKFKYAYFGVYGNSDKYSAFITTPSSTAIQTIRLNGDE